MLFACDGQEPCLFVHTLYVVGVFIIFMLSSHERSLGKGTDSVAVWQRSRVESSAKDMQVSLFGVNVPSRWLYLLPHRHISTGRGRVGGELLEAYPQREAPRAPGQIVGHGILMLVGIRHPVVATGIDHVK